MKISIALSTFASALVLLGCGGGSGGAEPNPLTSLTASQTTIASGASATLTWTTTGVVSCTASEGWTGSVPTSGSQATAVLTVDTTYTLTCQSAGGVSSAASVTIAVAEMPMPTVALTVTPANVTSGGIATLSWSSSDATSCTATGGWTGALAVSGSQSTGALTAATSYTLTCSGAGGASATTTATVSVTAGPANPTPPAPTVVLSAVPAAVVSGATSSLTWTSTNATACAAGGAWTGALPASGSQNSGPVTANSTFSLTCTGPGGTRAAAVAVVNVIPTATLTANPTVVAAGTASTLSWKSTNATACTANGAWAGPLAAAGTKSSGPVNINSTFSLICSGAGGSSAVSVAVINVTPTAMLSANPLAVASGAASTLTWSSVNATACTASGGWTGALAVAGTRSTGALTGTKSYSLTCSGAGGNSATAGVTVTTSNGTARMTPRAASLTLNQSQQFTAALAGGAAANWSVDGMGGGNATVGTISGSGLYTAPAMIAGTHAHTILASSVTDGTTAIGSVAITDLAGVYSYHNNASRDGVNAKEYALTAANVNPANFGIIAKCAVDGAIYAQPLWVANLTVAGARHNVVFVATEHDGLYAFDADSSSCNKLWSVNMIDANHGAAAGEIPVPSSYANSGEPGWVGAGFGDISPEVGITGTPVIDPATNTLYVVTKSTTNTAADIAAGNNRKCLSCVQRLHAIDITTGSERAGSPVAIDRTVTYPGTGDGGNTVAFDPAQELQRTGLALMNGVVYVAFTAHEDKLPWYGWMMSYRYGGGGFTRTAVINVAPNQRESGIWMSGGAPAVDPDNNTLYALTGNGVFDVTGDGSAPHNDYGDSLVQFNATDLSVQQFFTPPTQATDNSGDVDFGAGGATVMADLPGSPVIHALICGGKDGRMYVLNRDRLGSYGDGVAGTTVEVQNFALRKGKLFATGAIWSNFFYITSANGPVEAWQLNPATTTFARAHESSLPTGGFGGKGATPSVSAAATQNGIVWALNAAGYCTHAAGSCTPTGVYAYDANNLATMLWNSTQTAADAAGYPVKFAVPTIANGKVYVGTRGNNVGAHFGSTSVNGELDIYGLKP